MSAASSPWTTKISTLYGKKALWKEGPYLEFKKSKTKLSDDLWESYSAFANTGGGIIVLGVDDRGNIEGVENVEQQIKNLINCLNNPEKVSINLTSSDQSLETFHIEGKSIIIIRVPAAQNSQKPVYLKGNLSQTYFRQNESDIKCSSSQIQQMIRDKCEEDLSAKLIPHTSWECVDSASWTSYRKRLNSYTPDHPWNALGDKELLEKLGGYTRETSDSQEGLTLAGLLMFGTDDAIRKFFRTHQLNYYEYDGREETDPDRRWIDRIYPDGTWSGNLYQFFFRILPRLTESIKKPFRLNHDLTAQGETTAHKAIREALANTIVHADYRGEGGLIIKKYPDRLVLTNPGTLLLSKERIFRGGISKCRNISLQTMFQRIGIVEKAGSGIDVILRGWMEQCLMPPEVLETTDPPQVTWTLPFIGIIPQSSAEKLEQLIGSEQYQTLTLAERMILLIAFEKNAISHADIHELLPMLHPSDLTKILQVLVDRGYLLSEGRTRAKKYKLASPTNTRNNSQMSQFSGEMSQFSGEMSQLSGEMSQLPESACLVRKKLKCKQEELEKAILDLCRDTWTDSYQLAKFLEREKRTLQRILKTMVLHGLLDARFPQHPSHPQQAYRTRQTLTEHS